MPRAMKPRPNGSDVQNTVDLSTSVSVGAWMSAAPSPRSAKSGTKIANAMTMLAIPNSVGASRRARMSSNASLVTCVTTSAAIFHATPRAAARFRSVGSSASIDHRVWTMSMCANVPRARERWPRGSGTAASRSARQAPLCAAGSALALRPSRTLPRTPPGGDHRPAKQPSFGAAGTGSRRATRTTPRRRRRAARRSRA